MGRKNAVMFSFHALYGAAVCASFIWAWPSEARADCEDPHSCICDFGNNSGVYELTVLNVTQPANPMMSVMASARVDDVFFRTPDAVNVADIGDEIQVPGWSLSQGDRVFMYFDAQGSAGFTTVRIEDGEDGDQVRCVLAEDFVLPAKDALNAMLSSSCGQTLDNMGFPEVECNDTVVLFGCVCAPGQKPAWPLLIFAVALVWRRRAS